MARKNQVVAFAQLDNGTLQFTVGEQSFNFNPDKASAANRIRAELHGWRQRISDKAAIERDDDGTPATPEMKFERMRALAEFYEGGGDEWNMRGAGGGAGRRTDRDIILQALAEVQGSDVVSIAEKVERAAEKHGIKPDAYLRRVATSADVAARIAAIKYGATHNADAMLDELGDE